MIEGETVKSGVARRLAEGFTCPIYKERVMQGFQTPCLFIEQGEVKQKNQLNGYVLREYGMIVHYYPQENSKTPYEDCAAAGNILAELLRIIDADGLVRGTNSRYSIKDGALSFQIVYPLRLVEESHTVKMQKAAVHTQLS